MRNRPRIIHSLAVICFALTIILTLFPAVAFGQRSGIPLPKNTHLPEAGVELEMLRYNRLPMIEIMINGKGPYRLIVDTGAAGVVLKKDLVSELELPPPPGMSEGMQIQVRAPGSSGLPASLHFIDSLTAGEIRIDGVWTIGMDLPFGSGMDGVIGMDVFHDCLLTYDYPNQKMSFRHGELPPINDRDVLAYSNPQLPNSHPEIELKIDDVPATFMIDTGLRGWFAMSQSGIAECQLIQGPATGEMGLSAAGLIPSEVVRIENSISAGEFAVEKPVVRVMNGVMARKIVGTYFLENFKVTFDARNKRIQLSGFDKTTFTPPAVRSLGMGLRNHGQQKLVWYVHPKSHAAEIGIQTDDVIMTVNGEPIQEIFGSQRWQTMLQSSEQVTIQYQAKKDKSSRTANLKILEILSAVD